MHVAGDCLQTTNACGVPAGTVACLQTNLAEQCSVSLSQQLPCLWIRSLLHSATLWHALQSRHRECRWKFKSLTAIIMLHPELESKFHAIYVGGRNRA